MLVNLLLSRSPADATIRLETQSAQTAGGGSNGGTSAPLAPLGHGQEVGAEVHAGHLRARELGRQEAAAYARAAADVQRVRHAPRAVPPLEILGGRECSLSSTATGFLYCTAALLLADRLP